MMKAIPCLMLIWMLAAMAGAQVIYDATAPYANPLSQGWTASEVVTGGSGNVGPVDVNGELAWQIDDRLTSGSLNNPYYYQTVTASEIATFFENGWDYQFTFRVPEVSNESFSGFTGFAIRSADAPSAWAIPGGRVARVGFLIGSDAPGTFFLTPQPRNKVTFATGGGFHTVRVLGEPGSDRVGWFVDGVSQGHARVGDFDYASGTTRSEVNFKAGSSAGLNGPVQWRSLSLAVREAPTVVVNSDDLTISDGGVASSDTFRGVPFTAHVFNGLARFVFAGDLEFAPTDRVRGVGTAAISLTASGDIVVPSGAVVDVSASALGAGPGGGNGAGSTTGGGAGDGSAGGAAVSGGAGGTGGPVTGRWPNLVANGGSRGDDGRFGNWGTAGEGGDSGQGGKNGFAAYGGPNSGGVGRSNEGGGGSGGMRGSRSTAPGSGGRGGPGDVIGREPGRNGSSATANGGVGGNGNPGLAGASGGGGRVLRGEGRLTGGSGGASGQSGGGGGGGGGGGSGASGGGGGGEGAAYQFPAQGVAGRNGGRGGSGGKGGDGGQGGRGGAGGEGGHGGGALEMIAYGRLRFAGEFVARGNGGQPGSPGLGATNNGRTTRGAGGDGATPAGGGNGGAGTRGGNGGVGATGGNGGRGGGGAGGTIRLMASSVSTDGMTVNVTGGANGGATGRVLVLSDTDQFQGSVLSGNEIAVENFDGQRAVNTHLSDFESTPVIPGLVKGTDVAGLLNGYNAGSFPSVLAAAP